MLPVTDAFVRQKNDARRRGDRNWVLAACISRSLWDGLGGEAGDVVGLAIRKGHGVINPGGWNGPVHVGPAGHIGK